MFTVSVVTGCKEVEGEGGWVVLGRVVIEVVEREVVGSSGDVVMVVDDVTLLVVRAVVVVVVGGTVEGIVVAKLVIVVSSIVVVFFGIVVVDDGIAVDEGMVVVVGVGHGSFQCSSPHSPLSWARTAFIPIKRMMRTTTPLNALIRFSMMVNHVHLYSSLVLSGDS